MTGPLFALVALAVYLDSGCPIFFRLEYFGRHQKVFRQWKFRTMKVSLEPNAIGYVKDDPRVTRAGRYLRASALDELPQLVNILKGDMSFVGPRPVAVDEVGRRKDCGYTDLWAIPNWNERCRVRPGLTGVSQLYLPKLVDLEDRFASDVEYIQKQSLFLDIKLIVMAFWVTVRIRWEVASAKF